MSFMHKKECVRLIYNINVSIRKCTKMENFININCDTKENKE